MPSPIRTGDEQLLLAALRERDESAFAAVVDEYGASMRRFALTFVKSGAVADEVVQDVWMGVLHGIDRFEGRSSLKTWLFRIVANKAKTRAVREARSVPFSALTSDDHGPTVSPDRFQGPDGEHPGGWVVFPTPWTALPEDDLIAHETRKVIDAEIARLPEQQRVVITLRDIEGLDANEVCNVLEITETNQRVVLHRARSRVRTAIERYLTEG
jgi:RNA polymerase sigma-70 factor (ECF subfamily)